MQNTTLHLVAGAPTSSHDRSQLLSSNQFRQSGSWRLSTTNYLFLVVLTSLFFNHIDFQEHHGYSPTRSYHRHVVEAYGQLVCGFR
jgi:hypothetical protein